MQLQEFALLSLLYVLLNLTVFSIYWWDKRAAAAGSWRVRESTLLLLALAGGSLGAVLAQRLLRHKTRKEPFRTILALIASLHIGLVTFLAGVWLVAPDALAAVVRFDAYQ